MFVIQNITTDPKQTRILLLQDGSPVRVTMEFKPMQYGWFFNTLTYGDNFVLNGLRITNSPNMLHQWRNLIPFGLACFSVNNSAREPSQQADFSSGASILYFLSAAEVLAYSDFLSGKV